MSRVVNPFSEKAAAESYDQYRPRYHDLAFQKLHAFVSRKFENVLDVACGTGHSTEALAKISKRVVGCDLSSSMLEQARKDSNLEYIQSPAEKLPFADQSFDYLNISMAFHWVDQPAFLRETRRVLKKGGWLGVDNYGFTGEMKGDSDFGNQHFAHDSAHFPIAVRHPNYPTEAMLHLAEFRQVHEIHYVHDVTMNADKFLRYLLTRSNSLLRPSAEQPKIEKLVRDFYEPFFAGQEKTLVFVGFLKLYSVVGNR